MNQPPTPRQLESRLQRLDRRIDRMEALNRRFSIYRLVTLAAAVALTWAAGSLGGPVWVRWSLAAGLMAFTLVVAFHRRLDGSRLRIQLWRSIQAAHRARLNLDWDNLPPPVLPPNLHRSPLDVDLDLTGERSLHRLLDCAASIQGSRLLSERLTSNYTDLEIIQDRQSLVRDLKPMGHFRNRLTLASRLAARQQLDGEKLLGWLAVDAPTDRLRWALPLAGGWAALNLTLLVLDAIGSLPPYWTLTSMFYLAFYYFNIRIFQVLFNAVVDFDGEIGKFSAPLRLLERWPLVNHQHLTRLLTPLRSGRERPSVQLHRLRWITAGVGLRMNPVIGVLLNWLTPWDYFFAFLADRARNHLEAALPEWFRVFYELEAAASLANWADLHPDAAFPQFHRESPPAFEVTGLGHPLILSERKIRNDFRGEELGQIAIITGSNMAGKSTFIKAIGINLCMAYAGGAVDARRLVSLPYHLYTVIRISDSLSDGYSYFYAEVRRLKGLLDLLEKNQRPVLYLVDEIFRGTNNRERLIGSRATLRALLTKSGLGFLATHDLELAGLSAENPKVTNYHFRDQVKDGRLVFDYTIHPGPSPTSNALRIMALEGLPVD